MYVYIILDSIYVYLTGTLGKTRTYVLKDSLM